MIRPQKTERCHRLGEKSGWSGGGGAGYFRRCVQLQEVSLSEPGMGGCADLGLTLLGSGVDVHGGSCVFMRACVCGSLLCVLNREPGRGAEVGSVSHQ